MRTIKVLICLQTWAKNVFDAIGTSKNRERHHTVRDRKTSVFCIFSSKTNIYCLKKYNGKTCF